MNVSLIASIVLAAIGIWLVVVLTESPSVIERLLLMSQKPAPLPDLDLSGLTTQDKEVLKAVAANINPTLDVLVKSINEHQWLMELTPYEVNSSLEWLAFWKLIQVSAQEGDLAPHYKLTNAGTAELFVMWHKEYSGVVVPKE